MDSKTLIELIKAKPLSNFDIKRVNPSVKITNSNDLFEVDFFDELFNEDTGVMLFLTFPKRTQKWGHWIGLLKRGTIIEWFDPYGVTPVRKLRKSLGGFTDSKKEEEKLHEIAKMNGYKLVFKRIPLQSLDDKDDQACGRYVLMHLAFKDLNLKQFHKKMSELKTSPDFIAVLGTMRH